jgi:hypothetical protein
MDSVLRVWLVNAGGLMSLAGTIVFLTAVVALHVLHRTSVLATTR